MVKFSTFTHVRSVRPTAHELPWDQFVAQYLTDHIIRPEKDGLLYAPASFHTPYREAANVDWISLLVFDIDNKVGMGGDEMPLDPPSVPEDHVDNLAGYTYAIHSTHSHTAAHPRWRLILPLARPVHPAEYPAIWWGGYQMLMGRDPGVDTSTQDVARLFWTPSCHPDHAHEKFAASFVGEAISPDDLIEASGLLHGNLVLIPPRPGSKPAGGRNNKLRGIVAAMLERGEPLELIVHEIDKYDRENHTPPLFLDRSEGYGAPSLAGAMKFAGRIICSIAIGRAVSGLPEELPKIRVETPGAPTIATDAIIQAAAARRRQVAVPAFPQHLLDVPGMLGEMMQWINACAVRPQPALALANTITLFGALFGVGGYQTSTGVRPNLYTVGIAETGAGKEHSRTCCKRLLQASEGRNLLGGERIASGSAILAALQRSRVMLFQLDEFGKTLQAVASPQAQSHLADIGKTLLEMYSRSSSSYQGTEYAGKAPVVIHQPHACLYATTTPLDFYAALASSAVSDGFLNRLVIITAHQARPPRQTPGPTDPPKGLVDEIKAMLGQDGNLASLAGGNVPVAIPLRVVAMTDQAADLFDAFDDRIGDEMERNRSNGLAPLFSRAWENAAKLAMIRAVATNWRSPIIDETDAKWGHELVMWSLHHLCESVGEYVADNQSESDYKRLLRVIGDAGADGITRQELSPKTQWIRGGRRQRDEWLAAMIEGGLVHEVVIKNGLPGRNPVRLIRVR